MRNNNILNTFEKTASYSKTADMNAIFSKVKNLAKEYIPSIYEWSKDKIKEWGNNKDPQKAFSNILDSGVNKIKTWTKVKKI
jgi:hypothetical protein